MTRRPEVRSTWTGDVAFAYLIFSVRPVDLDLPAGSGLVFEDRGEHDLKGMPGCWHLCRVAAR